jgi:hypothetical protein
MDGARTGTTAGIDPKIINNWQPDPAFSLNAWKQSGYNQQSEWESGQDSSPNDPDIVDLGAFHGPANHGVSVLARSEELSSVNKYGLLVLRRADSRC